MNILREYFRFFGQLVTGTRARHELALAAQRLADISPFTTQADADRGRVLDLANGRLRPQYSLLRREGQRVFGIDLANAPAKNGANAAYLFARWLYTRTVRYSITEPETLVRGDVRYLPFPNGCFSMVTSVAAFEHFRDVPVVINEVHRVLKTGGIAWVLIHPFTAPSGGHNVSLTEIPLQHLPARIEPWDHLRKRQLSITVPLNEWRCKQYEDEFERGFVILKSYCLLREGERWLTPDIAAKLSDYTSDELTCGSFVVVARKL